MNRQAIQMRARKSEINLHAADFRASDPVVTSVSPACPTRLGMLRMDKDQDKLLADALRGDQIALQQLLLHNYTRLADSIRTRVPAPLRPVVDVDDVLQSTFIQVFRGLSDFRDGDAEAFFAWMRSIATARLKDAIRSATRKKRGGNWRRLQHRVANSSGSLLDLIQLLSDQRRSPSGSVAAHEAIVALQVALAGLPEDQRQAIRLRHIESLTIEEVVQKMGRTEGAVRGLLHRGKASLKESLGNSSAWFSRIQ